MDKMGDGTSCMFLPKVGGFLQRVGIAESYSSAVYAMMLSVRLSVCLSVCLSVLRHIPVFCRDE